MKKPVETKTTRKLSINKDAIRTLEVTEADIGDDVKLPPLFGEATPPKRKPEGPKGTPRLRRP
jgi:hypothetical protein